MKNKLTLLSVFACAAALAVLSGCVHETPTQAIATGVYGSGYAVANDSLSHNPAVEAQLLDVAAKLPHLNDGTLTPKDMGVLQGELNTVQSTLPDLANLFPADSQHISDAEAFLAGVISSNASLNGGKAPTLDQVADNTALIDFANGIKDGDGYFHGKASVPKL
jgi:hypothetical protein